MCFYIVLLHCPFRRAWMGGGRGESAMDSCFLCRSLFFLLFPRSTGHSLVMVSFLWKNLERAFGLFNSQDYRVRLLCTTAVYDCCVRLLCKYLGISQHHNITTSQYHNITISQHHNITTSHYHNIAISHYHTPVGRFSKVDCSTSKRVPVPIVSHIERHVLRKLSARCFQRRPSRHRHY